jgi:hypothetical protein
MLPRPMGMKHAPTSASLVIPYRTPCQSVYTKSRKFRRSVRWWWPWALVGPPICLDTGSRRLNLHELRTEFGDEGRSGGEGLGKFYGEWGWWISRFC